MSKTAQNWFDKKYSKVKKEAKKININSNSINNLFTSIEGPLKIVDFEKLKSISLKNLKLTSLEISNCSQLIELDLSELSKLTSLSVSDCSKLKKLDFSRYKLTQLTELEVNNLHELDCSNTSIKKLSLNLCPNITKLNCSNNKDLIYLDISNCSKLEFLDCEDSGLTSLDLSNCPKIKDEDLPSSLEIIRKKIRNILIVGRTGSGKSTLSNVLTGTDEFQESASSVSVTINFQKKVFEWNGIEYCVVDTVGIGNTRLTEREVLYKIAEGIYSMPEGISQVLFAIDGGFIEEINAINFRNLFDKKNHIFNIKKEDILNYCTIVKTKFSNFKNQEECEKDRKQLLEESGAISKLVRSCNGIVYVDNPPTNIIENDDDDINANANNKRIRNRSRDILLKHLEGLGQDKFKLKTWDELHANINDNYVDKKN